MTDGQTRLTRRRVLAGAASMGLAGAGVGAGTMALLSDTESSSGNSIQAGTIDLTLNGGDADVQFVSQTGIAPGDSGQATVQVANAGSLTGYVDVEVIDLTNYENGLTGNENSVDGTGGDPGQGNGELQDYLEIHAEFANGPVLWSGFDTIANKFATGTVYDLDYQLSSATSDTFQIDWQLPAGTGDDAQGDEVQFTLRFSLDQEPDTGA